jgi:hypothetical protein
MITVVIQFPMAQAVPASRFVELAESNAALYKGLDGLHRKYYISGDDGSIVGGIYLWESRAAAEACYDDAWRTRVTESYGTEPQMAWFDTPVVLDNVHDELIVDN